MKNQTQKLKTPIVYRTNSNQPNKTKLATLVHPEAHASNPFKFSRPGEIHLYQVNGFEMGVVRT